MCSTQIKVQTHSSPPATRVRHKGAQLCLLAVSPSSLLMTNTDKSQLAHCLRAHLEHNSPIKKPRRLRSCTTPPADRLPDIYCSGHPKLIHILLYAPIIIQGGCCHMLTDMIAFFCSLVQLRRFSGGTSHNAGAGFFLNACWLDQRSVFYFYIGNSTPAYAAQVTADCQGRHALTLARSPQVGKAALAGRCLCCNGTPTSANAHLQHAFLTQNAMLWFWSSAAGHGQRIISRTSESAGHVCMPQVKK